MAVSFELPDGIERQLRAEVGNLDALAKEAVLVELYRQAKLTHHQLGSALGLDRFATDALLKLHGVHEDLVSPAEFDEQFAELRRRLGG